MKHIILFLLITFSSFGQEQVRFYNLVFDQSPKDYQLYPRDTRNQSAVTISGQIEIAGWQYLSVVVSRNKKFYGYYRNNFSYDNTGKIANFLLKPIIQAELAEYDFQVYASQTGKDSVLALERKNIVSGDMYLIYGQSNARAWEGRNLYRNEYCRTFGYGSFKSGYNWGLSNADFTGGFDGGEAFIVGEWGIEIQKNIVEKYGIPSCIINAATSGAPIATLLDRNPNNPADINTRYGRLVYLTQKSGLINDIKALFYWQGETDATQDPSLWKPGFDKMYNFWLKDLPSIKKIYTLQLPLFGQEAYNEEVGVLRDYMRQLGSIYPKITPYAPLGATEWDGFHFKLAGYVQVGRELSGILGKEYYGEDKPFFSPNIQKVYFSNAKRDEITLAFENGQQMIYPKDTITENIGGGLGSYGLKDFFYVNKVWQRVISGKAEGNRIVLTLKQPATVSDTLLKYLPSVYPYSKGSFLLTEAPWAYIGPFLKNTSGMRAFAFHHLKIAPFKEFRDISFSNIVNVPQKISFTWNLIEGAKGYVLERISAKDSTDIQFVKQLPITQTSYTDSTVFFDTGYVYRLKAYTNLQESNFKTLFIKSSKDPNSLITSSNINYFNSATIAWQLPTSGDIPESYSIERRKGLNGVFQPITKIIATVSNYTDTTLSADTQYFYRITSNGNNTNFRGQIELRTPALLSMPALNSTVLYYNSAKLSWNLVQGVSTYVIERKFKNENFQQMTKLNSNIIEWIDKDMVENSTYTYLIKALGNKTESLVNTTFIQTPALLSTPELTSDSITYNSMKLKWKAVSSANNYVLERLVEGESNFQKVLENNNIFEFTDKSLKQNRLYSYRLKAFGNLTESLFGKIDTKTLTILAIEEEDNNLLKVYPNPAKDKITISFSEPKTADIYVKDLLGRNFLETKITKQKTVSMDISGLQRGIYFLIVKTDETIFSRKVLVE